MAMLDDGLTSSGCAGHAGQRPASSSGFSPVQARSYKTEIIVFLMAGTRTVEIGLNLIFNMRDLGYDHW